MPNQQLLTATRLELHWASRILSAAADATLDKVADDSHTNLGWDSERRGLVGRVGADLHVPTFTLHHEGDSLELRGASIDEGLRWLGGRLNTELTLREYDWPDSPRPTGAPFAPSKEALDEIADWFILGAAAMAGRGELRIWPHHFDLGFFQDQVGDGRSIGGGFTIGDDHYASPYFYVNPYGVKRPDDLPDLVHGSWTDKWFGAVMTMHELRGEEALDAASTFIRDALEGSHKVLSGPF